VKCQHPWCESPATHVATIRLSIDDGTARTTDFDLRLCSAHARVRAERGAKVRRADNETKTL